jgi:hypothetical protein
MEFLDRRTFLAGAAGALTLVAGSAPARAQARSGIVMYKDPNCGCCTAWAERMQAHFRQPVRIAPTADMAAFKRARGIPQDLWSCHTSEVHGYLTEGPCPPGRHPAPDREPQPLDPRPRRSPECPGLAGHGSGRAARSATR